MAFFRSTQSLDFSSQQKAKILSALLIIRGLACAVHFCYAILTGNTAPLPFLGFAFAINLVAYGLSRTQFYSWGAGLIIFEGIFVVPIGALSNPDLANSILRAPLFLSLGILVSTLILKFRSSVVVILATAGSMTVIAVRASDFVGSAFGEVCLFMAGSAVLGLIGNYMRDQAEQRLEEERAKAAQVAKLSALGEVAAGIAHEINTPVAAMVLNAQMMIQKNKALETPSLDVEKRAQNIISIGQKISKTISNIKSLSRDAKDDQKGNFTLKEIFAEALPMCSEKALRCGVDIQLIENEFSTIPLNVRNIQICQVLLGLFNNSIDAVESLPQKWIHVECLQVEGHLEIRVSDSGSGISKEVASRIFQPYFSTKPLSQGVGLGLGICQGLVRDHGGTLKYESSNPNTTFLIRLPLASATTRSA